MRVGVGALSGIQGGAMSGGGAFSGFGLGGMNPLLNATSGMSQLGVGPLGVIGTRNIEDEEVEESSEEK